MLTIVACPLCHSETGERVWDGIFNNMFGSNLLAMILPFLVITVVVGLIYGSPVPRSQSTATPPNVDGQSPDSSWGEPPCP